MAVEPATEALRATLDLLSQTKMGQLFKLLDLLIHLQLWKFFLFFLFSFIFKFFFFFCKWLKNTKNSIRIPQNCHLLNKNGASWMIFKLIQVPREIHTACIYMH